MVESWSPCGAVIHGYLTELRQEPTDNATAKAVGREIRRFSEEPGFENSMRRRVRKGSKLSLREPCQEWRLIWSITNVFSSDRASGSGKAGRSSSRSDVPSAGDQSASVARISNSFKVRFHESFSHKGASFHLFSGEMYRMTPRRPSGLPPFGYFRVYAPVICKTLSSLYEGVRRHG